VASSCHVLVLNLPTILFNLKEENIMTATIHKSKSQLRQETSEALEKFLKSGGSIEVVKSKKAPKQKMSAKTTRNSSTGTSGFAMGYSRSSF
jgi:hypothetical protein